MRMVDITPHDALPGETPAEYFARHGPRPMAVGSMLRVLEKIREKHGEDVELLMVDDEPVVRAVAQPHSLNGQVVVYVSDR
jgi:hypothetical protein